MNQIQIEVLLRSRECVEETLQIHDLAQSSPKSGHAAVALSKLLCRCHPAAENLEAVAYAGVTDWQKCRLVDFRADPKQYPGRQGHQVLRVVQLPRYYLEIQDFVPLTAQDLERRHEFAKNTGFLLLGKDEVIAVEYRGDDTVSFCDVYENNDNGFCRKVNGIYAPTLAYYASPKKIADLDATQTKSAISETIMAMSIGNDDLAVSQQQIDMLIATWQLLEEHAKVAPPERKASGASIKRWFFEGGNVDSVRELRKASDGWKQYSTYQDAWYFGVWVNQQLKQTLTYCEQDVSHVICDDDGQFTEEMADMAKFYGASRTPDARGYGQDGSVTNFFGGFYFLDGKVSECVLSENESKCDPTFNGGAPLLGAIKIDHPTLTNLKPGEVVTATSEFFSLDLLSPLAFEAHEATVTKCLFGFQVDVIRGVKHHIGLIKLAIEEVFA
jgi:hypothetical protein